MFAKILKFNVSKFNATGHFKTFTNVKHLPNTINRTYLSAYKLNKIARPNSNNCKLFQTDSSTHNETKSNGKENVSKCTDSSINSEYKKHGIHNGVYEIFDKNGVCVLRCTFKNGILDGPYEMFNSQGESIFTCTFNDEKTITSIEQQLTAIEQKILKAIEFQNGLILPVTAYVVTYSLMIILGTCMNW